MPKYHYAIKGLRRSAIHGKKEGPESVKNLMQCPPLPSSVTKDRVGKTNSRSHPQKHGGLLADSFTLFLVKTDVRSANIAFIVHSKACEAVRVTSHTFAVM